MNIKFRGGLLGLKRLHGFLEVTAAQNKGLIAEAYEWDKADVSSDDNEMVEVKVLMALAEENDDVSKEGVDQPWLSKVEDFILPNHATGRILPSESQRNTTDPSVAVTDSSATDYDSTDESSVYSTPLPPLKKLDGVEPISKPKTIKSILRSKSTFKAEALKSVIINEPSSAPTKGNKSSSASKVHSAPASKLKSVKIEDNPPLAIDYLPRKRDQSKKSSTCFQKCKACGRPNHTTTDHYGIEWFKRDQDSPLKRWVSKLKLTVVRTICMCDIRKPIWYMDSSCSRHMTGVKSYLHKYVEQPGPKVVFGDDSTCKQTEVMALQFYINNHKDHIGKFDEKADDGYLLGYSLVSKAFRISEYLPSPNTKDTSTQNTTIPSPPLPVPSMVTLAPQDRWSQDKHIELVNIIGNPEARMLTRAMAKQLSAASAHECLFVDFISEKEPKKVSKALQHPGWVDAMQYELNQFARNKWVMFEGKERVKITRVRGMILAVQSEAFKHENVLAERLHGLDQHMEIKGDESLYFINRIWVLLVGSVMDEAHALSILRTSGERDKRFQDVMLEGFILRDIARMEILVTINQTEIDDLPHSFGRQSERMIRTLEDIMRACVIDFGGSYQFSIRCAPFEALYRRKCRSPVLWAEIRESSSFWKEGVHDTFHVSNLKKCLADANLHVPLDEIKVDKTLHFVEEPVVIMDQEIKKLKRRKIALVKVRWNSKRGPEFTWEHEDHMRIKYP
ncbi:hypothetical protein Tco_0099875 [Tanacetum coccineum]